MIITIVIVDKYINIYIYINTYICIYTYIYLFIGGRRDRGGRDPLQRENAFYREIPYEGSPL